MFFLSVIPDLFRNPEVPETWIPVLKDHSLRSKTFAGMTESRTSRKKLNQWEPKTF